MTVAERRADEKKGARRSRQVAEAEGVRFQGRRVCVGRPEGEVRSPPNAFRRPQSTTAAADDVRSGGGNRNLAKDPRHRSTSSDACRRGRSTSAVMKTSDHRCRPRARPTRRSNRPSEQEGRPTTGTRPSGALNKIYRPGETTPSRPTRARPSEESKEVWSFARRDKFKAVPATRRRGGAPG